MQTGLGWSLTTAALMLLMATASAADGNQSAAKPKVWSNATELSVVRTEGNADTQTFGFKNTLRRMWPGARLRVRVDGVRSRTGARRILVVQPGLRFAPGEWPEDFETVVGSADDARGVEQYFVEGRVEFTISDRFFWNAGTSWDRNKFAGIRNRYLGFGGIGTQWIKKRDVSFSTGYGISYTARHETNPDVTKDDRFGGIRFDSDYHHRLGAGLELDSDFAMNMNLHEASDYSVNVTNAVGVAMTDHLSLRVSLQHLYERQPALEDSRIVGRVKLVDPDGVPGSGDELFETIGAGGTSIDFGSGRIRKNGLDTIFRTALVISF